MNQNQNFFVVQVVLLLFLVGISTGLNAQTFNDDTDVVEVEIDNEILEGNVNTIFDGLGISNAPNPLNTNLVGSKVFLQQIGDLNVADISVNATSSDISVVQNGNQNTTFLDYQVRTVVTDIIQNGDGNVLSDFVIDPLQDVSLDVQQQGNYLTFERFGANELTRSLRFIQTEASPSIIVKSFN